MPKPQVTKTTHLLPFGELSPAQFERLCLWLVEREGYLRAEHLGEAGSEQGRDVIAFRATGTGEQLWYFQCKRYQTINVPTLIKEIEKYNALASVDATKKPFGIVFVTNAVISAGARERVRKFCSQHSYECEFWARTELDLRVKKHADIVSEYFNISLPVPLPQDEVSIARLPTSGSKLFGRDAELRLLDEAWENPKTNIIAFVAWGGMGKTALVNHWLKQDMARDNYRGAERVYGWSFYSQGTSERAASADLFIDQALRWFGDTDPTQGSPWDKGERLARFIRQKRTLLILDGVEPLQHPPGPQEGRLKDAALQSLLVELAGRQPGLCVISTREQIGDLVEFEKATVVQHRLEDLSPQAGVEILRSLNVKGEAEELEEAARELDGHAYSLTLLGSYLDEVLDGDIRRRKEIENLFEDTRHGDNARKMIAAYEGWLGEGVEIAVLRLLGLFDHPAEAASIAVLRDAPAISGLTEVLQNLKPQQWNRALAKLRRIKLLDEASPDEPGALNAHPLVREYFKQELKRERLEAWREANNRLYEHLLHTTQEFPDTVEEMSRLFSAVAYGSDAGRYREALYAIYSRRIQRTDQFFSFRRLGAFGAVLASLSGFFEIPWRQPVTGLTDSDEAFVLNMAGLCLRALGRSLEALEPTRASLEKAKANRDWKNASIDAGNLSELYLIIGNLQQALEFARSGVQLARDSNNPFHVMSKRVTLGDALHQAGQLTEAATSFSEAEAIQNRMQPEFPILYSVQGFQYCDLLLDQKHVQQVKDRVIRTLTWAKQEGDPLSIALDNLSLGRALLLEAQLTSASTTGAASDFLELAVEGLREAKMMHHIPRGLLARASLHRFTGAYETAERDLAQALRIAKRGGMALHLADYHLESARLQLAHGDQQQAREHWTTAKEMIGRMGYHRRDEEVREIGDGVRAA